MRALLGAAGVLLLAFLLQEASAGTWHVDASVATSGDGTSPEKAFRTIQEGIDAAFEGDTVVVAEGLYSENVRFNGKNLVLRSIDPCNPDVVAATIIDAVGAVSVVAFMVNDDETCVLSGFTIRNGKSQYGAGICGVYIDPQQGAEEYTRAVIQHNIITGNSSEYGGGVALFAGPIRDNVIAGNATRWRGGGIADCSGPIQNNVIRGNSAQGESSIGGGLFGCGGIIENNLIVGNSADDSGGLGGCGERIENNTIVHNRARRCGGIGSSTGTIRNCILWGNTASESASQIGESGIPFHSCIEDWDGGGLGNIAEDPLFIDADGPDDAAETYEDNDYRLQSGSPCMDAGVSYYWCAWPQRDLDGNCRLVGESVDMGCYESGSSSDSDGDLLSDADELTAGTRPDNADSDSDGLRDGLEILRGSDPTSITGPGVLEVPAAFASVQQAVSLAVAGDEIVVAPATYNENIVFSGCDIVLRSQDPSDGAIVASTILDGNGAAPVISFSGFETEACVLAGLTIRNGKANYGGGICGGSFSFHTGTTLRDNVITGNSADNYGGGVAFCDGWIVGNVITANSASSGGAIASCNGDIERNTITGNSTVGDWGFGGALYSCAGTISHNTISGNSTVGYGGGLASCSGTIQNNRITSNSTVGDWGLGGGLYSCDGLIQNNEISRNSVTGESGYGAGLAFCSGTVQNNTICANSATAGYAMGGGLYGCSGRIRNCIVWGNTAAGAPDQMADGYPPTFSCIQNWTGGGERNTAADPQFVSFPGGDYHLRSGSPCIDAGADFFWFTWPQLDLDGNCRRVGESVDMGCYEYGSFHDADGDLLSDEEESSLGTEPGLADTDGDGLRDGLEVLRGSDPNTPTPPGILEVPSGIPTIQQALCLAVTGDEIVVAPGVYQGNFHFGASAVTLRSSDPESCAVVTETVLDGNDTGPVVSFSGTETEAYVLAGFTIRNGQANYGGGICGGNFNQPTRATIRNNVITHNAATYGAGLAYCNGLIRNNVISSNTAEGGGGGLAYCDGMIVNNTISNNLAAQEGTALYACNGIISNCIIRGSISQSAPTALPSYCCIMDWAGGGEGNISAHPYFLDPESGDFHLQSWSPCIDTGAPSSDFSNEPEPNGGRVNIGAYGNTPEAASGGEDTDADSLPDDWEMLFIGNLDQGADDDTDGDGVSNLEEYWQGRDPSWEDTWYVKGTVSVSGDGKSWERAFRTIQEAIDAASDGQTVLVAEGTYVGRVQFKGKNVILRSTDPLNRTVVAGTILDARGKSPVVLFSRAEDGSCVLSGFTIRNGQGYSGGGIQGNGTRATIQHCVITGNSAEEGAGLHSCNGIIENNVIADNSAGWAGGGLAFCEGTVQNNVITDNDADGYGGGLGWCYGVIRNNTILGNTAGYGAGGGLAACSGTILNCIIWGNTASSDPQLWACSELTYSCIDARIAGGEGNLTENPRLVDPDGPDNNPRTYQDNDYTLSLGSPCIDAGQNEDWMSDALDLNGNPRIFFGGSSITVDMGACEYRAFSFRFVEVRRTSEGQTTMTWMSRPQDAFVVWSCTDLLLGNWQSEGFLFSQGDLSTWTDADTTSTRKFYRIGYD